MWPPWIFPYVLHSSTRHRANVQGARTSHLCPLCPQLEPPQPLYVGPLLIGVVTLWSTSLAGHCPTHELLEDQIGISVLNSLFKLLQFQSKSQKEKMAYHPKLISCLWVSIFASCIEGFFFFFSVIKLTYSQVCEKYRRAYHYSWPFWFWPLETQLKLDMQNYIVHIIRGQIGLLSQLGSLWLDIMPWGQAFSLPALSSALPHVSQISRRPSLLGGPWQPQASTLPVTQMKWHLFLPSCSDQSLQTEFH